MQIRRRGFPSQYRTFDTKADAAAWAFTAERAALHGHVGTRATLGDAFARYRLEVTPGKRGRRWEAVRLARLESDPLASKALAKLGEADLAGWRDRRLEEVSGPSVRREMVLIQGVLETARREWRWIERNPMQDVRKPADSKPRRRGVPQEAADAILANLTGPVGSEVARAFRFSIATAMRASEILSLDWTQVDLARRVASLTTTKNGDEREVPLSPDAIAILGSAGRGRVFGVESASLDRLFRKARDKTEYRDVHFHDARSEGITRLSKKLDVLELARAVGHRDIRSLMHYYRADAEALARKLG